MTGGTPWSVKGIDSKAREVAKDLARRSGMTLGEWLNHTILQGEDVEAVIRRERQKAKSTPRERRPVEPVYDEDDLYAEDDYAPQVARPAPRYDAPRYDARPSRPAPFSLAAQRDARRPTADAYYDEPRPARESAELGRVTRVLESLGTRIESSETRSASAVRGVSQAVEALLNRLERSESAIAETLAESEGRLEERLGERLGERLNGQTRHVLDTVSSASERLAQAEDEQAALAERLYNAERVVDAQAERLEGLSGHLRDERERVARLEADLKASPVKDTVQAVEGALGKLANQLYENDARSRDTIKDVRGDMVNLSHRLAQMEMKDHDAAAQQMVDRVVSQLSKRLEAAEAQTATAIRTLEQAFASLDARLLRSEERGDVTDPESVHSLTRLTADLTRRVEESRYEVMRALETSTRANLDQTVSLLNTRLGEAEARSAQAIETLGQDVLKIADNLNRRMTGVVQSSEDAASRTSAEVRRLSETLDGRFETADQSHARALERLSGEIARISERLTQKVAETERRTAQVLQGVGEELDTRHQRVNTDIADRIRQSEERTQKLLDEARSKIDSRIGQVQTQTLLQEAARPSLRKAVVDDMPNPFPAATTELQQKPFGAFEHGFDEVAEEPAPVAAPEPVAAKPAPKAPISEDDDIDLTGRLLSSALDFGDDPFADAPAPEPRKTPDAFDAGRKPDVDPFDDDDDFDGGVAELAMQAPLTPRPTPRNETLNDPFADMADDLDPFADVDASRKVSPARADAPKNDVFDAPFDEPASRPAFEDGGVSMSTRDALAAARAAVRASVEGNTSDKKPLGGLKLGMSRTKDAKPVKEKPAKEKGKTLLNAFKASSVAVVLTAGVVGGYMLVRDGAADKPATAAPVLATAVATAPTAQDLTRMKAMYDAASIALKANDPKGVEALRTVADMGYPQAQFDLSVLYDKGTEGLIAADKAQARRWVERAAQGGVPEAMYNLGRMYYNGEGGPQDLPGALFWLRKAAERGEVESQYGLGIMYMHEIGTAMNLTEAYKWLAIAAGNGDAESANTLKELRPQMTAEQIASAESQAKAFKPIGKTVVSTVAPTVANK
ncbi:SEL1-like repeat protein [Asticcacaulis sp. YBE204]|uniref:SEL1-like repeat protein n=1 Tax=Asticcacaulis sp. YBE204 TaxID=1282363 RepID=UPI0003C410ED|nr:SEL1-like repeat protein [Asticcacaulis sp. YBE204]ESQ81228.1 hypothetical protein AEYBE204_02515 [Asticcacaulis sp. YBE204]